MRPRKAVSVAIAAVAGLFPKMNKDFLKIFYLRQYFCTVLYRDCDTAGNGQEPNVMLTPLFYGQTKTVRTSTDFWSPYCDQVVLLYLVQDTLYTNYALVTTTTTK